MIAQLYLALQDWIIYESTFFLAAVLLLRHLAAMSFSGFG